MASTEEDLRTISAKEAEIYDRQLRVWGVDGQQRIASARVLLGGMHALNAEVAKNLVLAGVRTTLQDHEQVRGEDLSAQFFLAADDVGQNRATASLARVQELNPMVAVGSVTEALSVLPDAFFDDFDVVVLNGAPLDQQLRVDALCRKRGAAFFAVDAFGCDGIAFIDAGAEHHWVQTKTVQQKDDTAVDLLDDDDDAPAGEGAEAARMDAARAAAAKRRKLEAPTETKTAQVMAYPSLAESLASRWGGLGDTRRGEFHPVKKVFLATMLLRQFERDTGQLPAAADLPAFEKASLATLAEQGVAPAVFGAADIAAACRTARAELSHVSAIMGGVVGQEVIKVIQRNEAPVHNWFLFDEGSGMQQLIPPVAQAKVVIPQDEVIGLLSDSDDE